MASDAAAAAPAGDSLVQADLYDFQAGSEVFVRGRAAVVLRFDYPHVYWRLTDDRAVMEAAAKGKSDAQTELHRSFSCTPHIFQVLASKKRGPAEDHNGGTGDDATQHLDNDTSDDDDEPVAVAPVEAPAEAAAAAPGYGAGARASLMSMFSRRPEKLLLKDRTDVVEAERIEVAAPQSVNIEACVRSKFTLVHKVSSLTLIGCEDCEVEFAGVISTVDILRCKRVTLKCTASAQTYTLESSEGCSIEFGGDQARVMFVSTSSVGTQLLAVPSAGSEEEKSDLPPLANEVRFTIEERLQEGAEELASPAPTPSEPADPTHEVDATIGAASGATKQYRTVWSQHTFSTEQLTRQGPLGYFSNANAVETKGVAK